MALPALESPPTAQRSKIMAQVRGKDTSPELKVRKRVFRAGFRFRLHDKSLPGKPDLVFPRFKAAVFVHGCFWHGHSCNRGMRTPKANRDYWVAKLKRNVERDQRNDVSIRAAGWRPFTIWECCVEEATADLVAWLDHAKSHQS